MFQTLKHTLMIEDTKWRILDLCHNKRNLGEYEGRYEVDERLVSELIAVTKEVLHGVEGLGPVPHADN